MKTLTKNLRTALVVAVLLSAALPIGIACTLLGATNAQYAVTGVGIAFIVAGFYGCPIAWIKCVETIALKKTLSAIEKERLCTIEEIATMIDKSEKETLRLVRKALSSGYLSGYKLVENARLEPNRNPAPTPARYSIRCDACGALVSIDPYPCKINARIAAKCSTHGSLRTKRVKRSQTDLA